jgi:chemotaxis protein CheC
MLDDRQLAALTALFQEGADNAADALSRWLERPASIVVEAAQQLPLDAVAEVLGPHEAPICACSMQVAGKLKGQLILAFDDASGLSLAETLLSRPSREWGEVEQSAALETANIVGCAYLNALARRLDKEGAPCELTPSPPRFVREFAESLMQFAVMDQAQTSDVVFLARTEFRIDGIAPPVAAAVAAPVNGSGWSLVFVPEADWMTALQEALAEPHSS